MKKLLLVIGILAFFGLAVILALNSSYRADVAQQVETTKKQNAEVLGQLAEEGSLMAGIFLGESSINYFSSVLNRAHLSVSTEHEDYGRVLLRLEDVRFSTESDRISTDFSVVAVSEKFDGELVLAGRGLALIGHVADEMTGDNGTHLTVRIIPEYLRPQITLGNFASLALGGVGGEFLGLVASKVAEHELDLRIPATFSNPTVDRIPHRIRNLDQRDESLESIFRKRIGQSGVCPAESHQLVTDRHRHMAVRFSISSQ